MSGSNTDLEFKFGAAGFQSIDASFDKIESRLGTAASVVRRYGEEARTVQRIFDEGKISADRYNQTMTALQSTTERQIQAAQGSASGFSRFSQAMGAAGFQAQDFAVQVQGGTSALTAMSQQLPQFLGIFGTGGAIAGAAVAAGALAIKFLDIGGNADIARERGQSALDAMTSSAQETAKVLSSINDLFLTAGQRAATLANLQRSQLRTQAQSRLDDLGSGRQELARRLAEEEAYLSDLAGSRVGQIWSGQGRSIDVYRADSARDQAAEAQAIVRVRELRSQLTGAEREAEQLRATLTRLDNAGRLGPEELGPASSDPAGLNAMRAQLDQRFAAQQQYEQKLRDIRAQRVNGEISEAAATEATNLALQLRNKTLTDLAEKAAKAAGAAKTLVDVFAINPDGSQGEAFQREAGVQRLLDRWRGQADRKAEAETKADERAREKREKEQERELERRQQREERVTDDIVQYSSDRFADMFTATEGGWNSMWQNMRRTALGLVARISAEAVIRPIVQPIVGSLMSSTALAGAAGSVSGSSSIFSGVGQALGLANLGETLGLGSISEALGLSGIGSSLGLSGGLSGALGTTLWTAPSSLGSAAVAGADPIAMAFATAAEAGAPVTLGSLLGGAGAGFGAGMLLNTLVGGKSTGGMIGSGGGALAGAAIGSIIPGIGTLIGGLIGGAGGGLLGGLFGPGKPNPAGSFQLGTDANGQLTILSERSKHMELDEQRATTQSMLGNLNSSIAGRGLSLRADTGISQIHFGNDEDPEADNDDLVRSVLGNLTGGSDSVMAVIAREIAQGAEASLETAFGNIDWVRSVYEPLTSTAEAVSAFDLSIAGVNTTFDAARAKAAELGLATDALVQKQGEQISALVEQRHLAVWGADENLLIRRLRATGQDEEADLRSFDLAAVGERAAFKANLESLGLTADSVTQRMLTLEETLGQERLAIAERYAEQVSQAEKQAAGNAAGVIGSLADYARSLNYSDSSPLGASEQFMTARSLYLSNQEAALGGDATALSQFQSYSQDYLTAARGLYGSGTGYADAFRQVKDTLGGIGAISPETLTQAFMTQNTETQTATLVGELQELRAAVDRLQREQQMTTAAMSIGRR
ncbi:hypothetical protein [Roseomonas sp. 18066]|uniref:hypothetical protein n=1 Tax=Roseomonas sp. 18066 TaxID=2681412 RepID=UPI00135C54E7|nr:hypothetical protein [Roseomonas sp. 18066]